MCSQPPGWLEAGTGEEQVSESKAEVAPLLLTHSFQPQRAGLEWGSLSVGFSCLNLPAGRLGRCPGRGKDGVEGLCPHSCVAFCRRGRGGGMGQPRPHPTTRSSGSTQGSAISL